MKIFHIIPGKANPNTLNGVNKVVDALATEQKRLGYDVTVVSVASNTIYRHSPIYDYVIYKRKKNPFDYNDEILIYLLKKSNLDSVFHFHSVFILWYLPLVRKLKKTGRLRIVLTPHGQYINEAMTAWKKKICFRFFDSKIIREMEAIQVIGCITENNKYINNNANRICVIPNGYELEDRTPKVRCGELTFGFLGRLSCKQKGIDLLLSAFAEYIKHGGNGQLKLAGGGPDEKIIRNSIHDLDLTNHVEIVGVVYDDKKWQYLQSISALITPSRWEGLPMSCLEASSIGCPQIITTATNLGPFVEKFKAGIIIEQADVKSIEKSFFLFEQVYMNKNLFEKMCNGAKQMIEKELNWNNIAKRVITELYRING